MKSCPSDRSPTIFNPPQSPLRISPQCLSRHLAPCCGTHGSHCVGPTGLAMSTPTQRRAPPKPRKTRLWRASHESPAAHPRRLAEWEALSRTQAGRLARRLAPSAVSNPEQHTHKGKNEPLAHAIGKETLRRSISDIVIRLALIPKAIHYSKVGLELGKLIFHGRGYAPP